MKLTKSFLVFVLCAFLSTAAMAKDQRAPKDSEHRPQTMNGGWTEQDWVNWWTNLQDLYQSGLDDEGMYWLLRHDLELLGYYEPVLEEIDIPAPYSGWSGGGGSNPPTIPYAYGDERLDRGHFRPMYGQMPSEWGDLILQHGLDPADFGGVGPIPAPPMWVAASISLLGTNLAQVPHPGTRVVGYVLTNAGGVMIIWIEVEEEDDDKDSE